MLISGHKINKYKLKKKIFKYKRTGIKKINDINNIYSMTKVSMNFAK